MKKPKIRPWLQFVIIFSIGIGLLSWLMPCFLHSTHGDGGNFAVHPDNIRQIRIGQTTKGNIKNIFGEPEDIKQSAVGEIWSYSRRSADTVALMGFRLGHYGWTNQLDVVFDEREIVTDFKFSVTKTE